MEMMGPGEPDKEGNTVDPKQRALLLMRLPRKVYLDVLECTPLPLMAQILAVAMNKDQRTATLNDMTPLHRAEVEHELHECLDDALESRMNMAGVGRKIPPKI